MYARFCATCHGDQGDGRGPAGERYGSPLPRDYTRGKYQFRSTEGGMLPLRSDLVRVIERGIAYTTMPAFRGVLAPEDLDAVAAYIESFSPRFGAEPASGRTVVTIPPEPKWPLSANQIETGRMLFLAFRCWECHGLSGKGDGPASPGLTDDWGNPDPPADLTRGKHRSGNTPTDLYRTLATGLEGTKMPTYRLAIAIGREGLGDLGANADKLSPKTRQQLLDFIAKLPAQDEIDKLSDEQHDYVAQVRLWLLVGYVRSLARPTNIVDWLFLDDPQEPQ